MTEEEADALLTPEALEILRTPAPCELSLNPPRTTRCATCQLVDIRVYEGGQPSCPACMEYRLEESIQEQKELRARYADLEKQLEDMMSAISVAQEQRDTSSSQRDALYREVTNLMDQLDSTGIDTHLASPPMLCGVCDCLAMTADSGGKTRCDAHQNGGEDLTYASIWRHLRKLVGRGG